jgi:hypothetical protein
VLPVFDGMKREVDDLKERRHNELMSAINHSREDHGETDEAFADRAFNEAMEHATMLSAVSYATLNVYAAALYHLTEQHIVDLYTRILDYHGAEITLADASQWFNKDVGLDMEGLPTWAVINELRLVANTIKHGGHAAKALCELRPDLFTLPHYRSEMDWPIDLRVRKPPFGEGVYVTEEDLVKYHDGSVAFWNEIAAVLPNLTR